MPASGILTLKKEERICSRTLTEKLFTGGDSRSMAAFPLRLVYMKAEIAAAAVLPSECCSAFPRDALSVQ